MRTPESDKLVEAIAMRGIEIEDATKQLRRLRKLQKRDCRALLELIRRPQVKITKINE